MASGLMGSDRCQICPKNGGESMCGGCKIYFCIKHFDQHRQQLSIKFDAEIVKSHDELLEQMNIADQSNIITSKLFDEINRWETETNEKVHKAAERARHQLTQLLTEEKDMLKKDFEIMRNEVRDRREKVDFDEIDIERLQKQMKKLQMSLQQLIEPLETKVNMVINDKIDWDRVINIKKKT